MKRSGVDPCYTRVNSERRGRRPAARLRQGLTGRPVYRIAARGLDNLIGLDQLIRPAVATCPGTSPPPCPPSFPTPPHPQLPHRRLQVDRTTRVTEMARQSPGARRRQPGLTIMGTAGTAQAADVNVAKNAGFESGLANWTCSARQRHRRLLARARRRGRAEGHPGRPGQRQVHPDRRRSSPTRRTR